LDYAAKTGASRFRLLDHLRCCAREGCGRIFVSPTRVQRYCRLECKRAVHRPKSAARVKALRQRSENAARALGLAAPPGGCLDQALLDPPAQRRRLAILMETHGLPEPPP